MVLARLEERACVTQHLAIHGAQRGANATGPLAVYGSDAARIDDLARERSELAQPINPTLPINGAQAVWAARHEMARTVDDVLARRTRALFLNARAALEMAPRVARLLAAELGQSPAWEECQVKGFNEIAAGFLVDTKP
jgi:glycerol-3-phosphate dehydrogenase